MNEVWKRFDVPARMMTHKHVKHRVLGHAGDYQQRVYNGHVNLKNKKIITFL